ncbi:hypothetical protein DdX_06005 [Ditylenchus destructor]|uniref:Uncharacterized protein n=1 Tax=Ditylenchus destructor TaxID=166010 RepID=A0AAD4N6G1_9BILA|nr:hypothetical protein DdX_06005 [Ditylenchus destructor]
MKLSAPLVFVLMCLLSLYISHSWARPTNSMTRIQQVFRTLMHGANKPMAFASRGKKSVGADDLMGFASDNQMDSDRETVLISRPILWILPMENDERQLRR